MTRLCAVVAVEITVTALFPMRFGPDRHEVRRYSSSAACPWGQRSRHLRLCRSARRLLGGTDGRRPRGGIRLLPAWPDRPLKMPSASGLARINRTSDCQTPTLPPPVEEKGPEHGHPFLGHLDRGKRSKSPSAKLPRVSPCPWPAFNYTLTRPQRVCQVQIIRTTIIKDLGIVQAIHGLTISDPCLSCGLPTDTR
jgi:hypothetical protein